MIKEQPECCRRWLSGSQLPMPISRSIRQTWSKLKSISKTLTITNYNCKISLYFWKSAEGKTILKSSLSRQICHQLEVKGSRPPILYEKCVQKCLPRPIHNFIQTHSDHLSKHLAGILGPSHKVVTFNPLCSHCFVMFTIAHILLEYYILLQSFNLIRVYNYQIKKQYFVQKSCKSNITYPDISNKYIIACF